MLFNSLEFLIFFPLVVAFYFLIPHRFRWILLLGASYYFYMCFKPEYLGLIIISTLVSYYTGIRMGQTTLKARRRKYLIVSLAANLGLLFVFKYFNFFSESLRTLYNYYNVFYGIPKLNVILPIGISFYTFQTLSYSIDVYRGKKEYEKDLGIFALYVAFFPQLVAGPIERAQRLLPQLFKRYGFDFNRVWGGLQLMVWGFFKKLVIADRLALYVDTVYSNPNECSGVTLIIATYFFAFQIYCDFSGYSDIAVGAAQVMGYDLMENFKRPYFAESVAAFWRRWHISLSSWFRDYLYIPLGGNRVSVWRWYGNIFMVFVVSGLWHGAHWTFVIWGGLHGCYILCSLWTKNIRSCIASLFGGAHFPTVHKCLRVFITFHLVAFAWIFFRAHSLKDAFVIIRKIFTFSGGVNERILFGLNLYEFIVAVLSILLLLIVQLFQRQHNLRGCFSAQPLWLRWALYYSVIFVLVIFGKFTATQFIYFQF